MTVGVPPTTFLEHKLTPVSKQIDGFGGPHVLMGLIASGGEPHIYITGNVSGNLRKEIYEALADKLRQMASDEKATPSLILPA
jgi:hypothetical protein